MNETLLIVDDEQQIRLMVRRLAETMNLNILEAESGEHAYEQVQQHDIDLIITDFKMPGIDGLELAHILLSQDPDRPVLLMTAYADLDSARKAIHIGIYEYFTKPFNITDVTAGLHRALEHRRMAREIQAYQRTLEQKMTPPQCLHPKDLMALVDQMLTPLSVAIGRINTVLMNQTLPPKDHRSLEIAQNQTALAVEILDAIQAQSLTMERD